MNYLAHLLLAGDDPADRLGAILGDFVKGPLPGVLPPDVAAGVRLHRRIDAFAEGNPAFCRSRARVGSERRRYAGIMVDMFYDHFLARDWSDYCSQPLASFSAQVYAMLEARAQLIPPRLAEILPYMQRDDWLVSYQSTASVGLALDRLAHHRLRAPNTLAGAIDELEACYSGFEADFREFFPAAQAFVARQRNITQIESNSQRIFPDGK